METGLSPVRVMSPYREWATAAHERLSKKIVTWLQWHLGLENSDEYLENAGGRLLTRSEPWTWIHSKRTVDVEFLKSFHSRISHPRLQSDPAIHPCRSTARLGGGHVE